MGHYRIFSNRKSSTGIDLYVNSNNKIDFYSTSTGQHAGANTTLTTGVGYHLGLTITSRGVVDFFLGTDASEMVTDGEVDQGGGPAQGDRMKIGDNWVAERAFDGLMSTAIMKEEILTLSEFNQLRQYVLDNVINP